MANRIHDAFASIQADDSLKTSTKQFLRKEREGRRKTGMLPFRQMSTAVCAMLLLVIGTIGFQTVSNTPVSYISIDVNPSIELTLNRWDRVITAEAQNEDGSAILDTLSVKGMTYTDAVDAIIDCEAMQPFLQNDYALTLTVASTDEKREMVLLTGIENNAGCQSHGCQSYKADPSLLETAHEHGLSLGKYSAFLELSRYDADVTPKDCQEMTMAQIRNRISECRNGNHESSSHSNHNGHGDNTDGQGQKGQDQSGNKQGHHGNHKAHNGHD